MLTVLYVLTGLFVFFGLIFWLLGNLIAIASAFGAAAFCGVMIFLYFLVKCAVKDAIKEYNYNDKQ